MNSISTDTTRLNYRPTPWDSRVFGAPTFEITDFTAEDFYKASELLRNFEGEIQQQKPAIIYCRVPYDALHLRKALTVAGYLNAETSLEIEKNDVQKFEFPAWARSDISLEPAQESDYESIRLLASEQFHYSRFHDDPFIDISIARKRYYNWIDDLIKQNKEIWIYRSKDGLHAMHIQSVNGSRADWVLTGASAAKAGLAFPLWATAFKQMQRRGVEHIHTLISAGNKGVANLYVYFQFRVKQTVLGYHKHF